MSNIPSSNNDDGDSFGLSSTPTPQPTFPGLHRTLSRSSQWSASDTPAHHNQGTSYFPTQPSSPTAQFHPSPILRNSSVHSNRRPARSTSVSSSQATNRGYRDDDVLSEANEDEDEVDDENEDNRPHVNRRGKAPAAPEEEEEGDEDESDPITTLKERQSLINVQHPFGLPIWKPALYKKSRSVTRHADEALHSIPSAQAERHLLPGNLFWAAFFGWWLGLICIFISIILYLIPQGGQQYSNLVYGLGWYLFWPFGKYVEGDLNVVDDTKDDDDESPHSARRWSDSNNTVRGVSPPREDTDTVRRPVFSATSTITPGTVNVPNVSFRAETPGETTNLLGRRTSQAPLPIKSYGTAMVPTLTASSGTAVDTFGEEAENGTLIGKICFWLALISLIAPLMLLVCIICWALVITVPMAKLNWALIKHLFTQPTHIRFCSAPPVVVVSTSSTPEDNVESNGDANLPTAAQFSIKHPRLSEGQQAPSGSPTSTVLLCTYRAVGLQYYKYTVGGVNILFVNLLPVVFFVIFDGFVLLPIVEKKHHHGEHVPGFLAFLASQAVIFFLSLTSVIPLSYFIGMAVASISAQSSIGMGAVINATFGSIIEIILYSIALVQGKGHLVEGSIVGSLLAGVLLMPGMSMCSGALRRKEQKFNAKSAGVTSMMLIMAIIGALAPTLFYQTYGNFQLVCSGCPSSPGNPGDAPWICDHCYYKHPDPVDDPFYQSTVKSLMYFCAAVLLFSYLIGLWFSLRTHASQIWQNPQQLLQPMELPTHRMSLYNKILHPGHTNAPSGSQPPAPLHRKPSNTNQTGAGASSRIGTSLPREGSSSGINPPLTPGGRYASASPTFQRKASYPPVQPAQPPNFLPVLESVDHAVKNADLRTMHLPEPLTTDDFTRAVAVATVSALRHQQTQSHQRIRSAEHEGGHGHDAPSWSRTTSASVLLACTALYAVIAELLVDVVDVVLKDSGIDEKFLGITLFALVPNTTEFMNAISFALNGNIALSMEIGSAYALQVCLLQIPAMVAFSAWYDPVNMGEVAKTFSLIFPRWDVIAIILSMFLMTYTYIEAKSNYHRGSILILSYLVLISGFYFAPATALDIDQGHFVQTSGLQEFPGVSILQTVRWYLHSLF
ncbi:Putative cation exchanger [Psilocybe cubensis]|uniref:Cation exchanger n=1 Tax=Psilocybe cubensis TaxID=181762 RepID=A0ACB8GYN6_PSICU|nr:Putative cation exchanger [Psilocybe cubensis]KAH9480542.1 Putative cation exchanger [Psilocybe cubensis]